MSIPKSRDLTPQPHPTPTSPSPSSTSSPSNPSLWRAVVQGGFHHITGAAVCGIGGQVFV